MKDHDCTYLVGGRIFQGEHSKRGSTTFTDTSKQLYPLVSKVEKGYVKLQEIPEAL